MPDGTTKLPFGQTNTQRGVYVDILTLEIKNATILKISSEELPVIAKICNIDFNGNYEDFSQILSQKFNNLDYTVEVITDMKNNYMGNSSDILI